MHLSLQSPYSQLLGTTTLTKLTNKGNIALTTAQRFDIRNYILSYLATRTKLPGYVQQAIVLLYARLTKVGWNDIEKEQYVFRTVTEDVTKFLQVRTARSVASVKGLSHTGEFAIFRSANCKSRKNRNSLS